MNKRKIQINQLKKIIYKGKKQRIINVKYQTVLAYFKQKDSKDIKIFTTTFSPLINDLLQQLTATEIIYKLQTENKEPIKQLPPLTTSLKLDSFELKALSKQYPIIQLCACLYIEKNDQKVLNIQRGKLMSFFKYLRIIYSDLSDCAGEKIIVEPCELRILYQLFINHWTKNEEKGKMNEVEKMERKIIRSLYFLGVLIQNNILEAIESAERRKRQEESDLGTKSEHQKNIKGMNQQVSTVHSIASLDPSNLSARLKSQNSQEQMYPIRNNLSQYSQYSQKSEKIISKTRFNLFDKIQIGNLKCTFQKHPQQQSNQGQTPKYQINYLSNDVQNILIEQAFKRQRFSDSCQKNQVCSPYQYCLFDYNCQSQQPVQYGNYYMGNNYIPYSQAGVGYQNHYPQYLPTYDYPGDSAEISQFKRSLNLVQTRKNDKDRYQ